MESPIGGNHVNKSLAQRLASVLPKDVQFGLYHVSTPPRKTDALHSAPPNERPDRTYCENHLLAVSIDIQPDTQSLSQNASFCQPASSTKKRVLILGVEIFIYTTAHATTLFVSKADSTGYLHLLKLPKGTMSPIREVCTAFIQHLVEHRRRLGIQFVISLFARSQGQYLFPGSADHGGKHILDDRGLIKWWCRVLDALIQSPPSATSVPWGSVEGYLVVPGLDTYETRTFIPRTATDPSSWSLTHPLEKISHYCREFDWVPPRCLIPRFPDDPKSRFRDELDDEAGNFGSMKKTGSWKSVKTLNVFWEMMAYRQECSSGRMTGFVWVVFDDCKKETRDANDRIEGEGGEATTPGKPTKQNNAPLLVTAPNTTPRKLFPSESGNAVKPGSKRLKAKKKKIKLRGPIKPRQPKAKAEQRNYMLQIPTRTAYYYWPSQGRGERIVNEATYKRLTEHMLHSDFSNLEKAISSSKRWIKEVGIGNDWGCILTGEKEMPTLAANCDDGSCIVNNLSGLVKRKRADTSDDAGNGVKTLSAELVRKVKNEQLGAQLGRTLEANILSAGHVRKKPKNIEEGSNLP